jgi:hypothetical protein
LQISSVQKQSEFELEIDLLKQAVNVLKSELDRELKQRHDERKLCDERIARYKQTQEESLRINKDLREKLDEAIVQKSSLEQLLQKKEHEVDQGCTEGEVDKFKKEFQRRKQLEEELENGVRERKQMNAALEQEILKRQRLEQDVRLLELNIEAERREQIEHNEEQEIQRRQLQHAIELELQKGQELAQELEDEVRRRHGEMQRRYELEMQLQEEIQVRHELEIEFKQADLQSQMLEQELRQQLNEMQRLFSSNGTEGLEIVTVDDEKGTSDSEGPARDNRHDALSSEEVFDKIEESEDLDINDNDDNNDVVNDEDEKLEIRLLLLEEFQRLQSQQGHEKLPTISVTVSMTLLWRPSIAMIFFIYFPLSHSRHYMFRPVRAIFR